MILKLNYYWATVYSLRSYSISRAMHLCRDFARAFDYALHILYHALIKEKRLCYFRGWVRERKKTAKSRTWCQSVVGIRRKAPATQRKEYNKMQKWRGDDYEWQAGEVGGEGKRDVHPTGTLLRTSTRSSFLNVHWVTRILLSASQSRECSNKVVS